MSDGLTGKPDDNALVKGGGHALATRGAALIKRSLDLLERPKSDFTFVALYAGIGGMRLGVEAAGGRCVGSCEGNRFLRTTYEDNFPLSDEYRFHKEIIFVDALDIPDHDLVVAKIPMSFPEPDPSLSNAITIESPRYLSEEGLGCFDRVAHILRVLHVKRPPAFLLETSTDLKDDNQGQTLETICERVAELGYELHWRVINTTGWVPQNREQLFLVGFATPTTFDFDAFRVPDPSHGPRLRTILHPENGTEREEPPYTEGPEAKVEARYILTERAWADLQDSGKDLNWRPLYYQLVRPDETAKETFLNSIATENILVDRGEQERPRHLTPRECARLMGFDKPSRPQFKIPASDDEAYWQFSSASVVPVVASLAEAMRPYFVKTTRRQQLELKHDANSGNQGSSQGG